MMELITWVFIDKLQDYMGLVAIPTAAVLLAVILKQEREIREAVKE